MKSAIIVNNLVKRYKKAERNAVDNISFSVKRGSFFALLGPNGAGKTTTVSVLNTTLQKTSGTVKINNLDIDNNASLVRKNIGVIFQNPSLDQNLTAEENVRFHTVLYGLYSYRPKYTMMPTSYKKKIMNLAKMLEIENNIFSPIKNLSGGMKRKLEIIRSLMHNPKVLFLDEPTSGLDPLSRKNLWKYLDKVRGTEKTTILLTTHYLEEAEKADCVAIINKGKIITIGTPREIKDTLVKNYLIASTKNKTALRKELSTKRLKYEENDYFKIFLNGKSTHSIIKSINTPLVNLDIHKPTLEEAYLEIIEGENNGNN